MNLGALPTADGPAGPSAERLRDDALGFLRRFGLVAAAWSALLGATAPQVAHPARLWAGIAAIAVWALAALRIQPPRAWWSGWLVVATTAELLGPIAGTEGWSVTGGATMIVIVGAALSGSAVPVAGAVAWLSAIAALRSIVGQGWGLGDAIGTSLLFAFGGLAVTWLVRVAQRSMDERDRLQADLVAARADAARRAERAEAAARLHDTVLQQLTAVDRAGDLADAREHAGRARNELKTFLRSPRASTATLRSTLERAVTEAAGGAPLSVGGAGDRPIDDAAVLLVDAAAEAVRNAARHAPGSQIRVFSEVDDDGCSVWVTDHGPGFDRAEVGEDRMGIRGSIEGRLERAGGTASLSTGPDGTEWHLRLPTP